MIDPLHVTDFDRSDAELEEFFLYCVLVANKNSDRIAPALDNILAEGYPGEPPFHTINRLVASGSMLYHLTMNKTGEYKRRIQTMIQIAAGMVPNLRTATPDELETIYGVGKKTSRFFIMHTRRDTQYAAIDTHILKALRVYYPSFRIPDKTPTGDHAYAVLERLFLSLSALLDQTPAELDLEFWTLYSGRGTTKEAA